MPRQNRNDECDEPATGVHNGKARPEADAVLLLLAGETVPSGTTNGEPGRNRTYNQQIKRRRKSHCTTSQVAIY